jgi:hypothetical protein
MTAEAYPKFGLFLVLLIVSALVLVLLFGLAARRKYFFHIVPFAAGYAALAAVSLRVLGLQDFFWWYLVLSSVFFSVLLTRHLRSRDSLDAFAQLRESALKSVREDEIRQQLERELAPDKQATQHLIGSAVAFIVSLVLAFYAASYVGI